MKLFKEDGKKVLQVTAKDFDAHEPMILAGNIEEIRIPKQFEQSVYMTDLWAAIGACMATDATVTFY